MLVLGAALRAASTLGPLEMADDSGEAVKRSHSLLRRFQSDELETQRRPSVLSGLAVTKNPLHQQRRFPLSWREHTFVRRLHLQVASIGDLDSQPAAGEVFKLSVPNGARVRRLIRLARLTPEPYRNNLIARWGNSLVGASSKLLHLGGPL